MFFVLHVPPCKILNLWPFCLFVITLDFEKEGHKIQFPWPHGRVCTLVLPDPGFGAMSHLHKMSFMLCFLWNMTFGASGKHCDNSGELVKLSLCFFKIKDNLEIWGCH